MMEIDIAKEIYIATRSIFLGVSRLNRLNLTLSYDITSYTVFLSHLFVLSHSFQQLVDPQNCIDSDAQVVSSHLILFVRSSGQNPSA
jgi:hypothetical protein